MASPKAESETTGPVTLEELAVRGFVPYTVGPRFVRLTCEDAEGRSMVFLLPEQTAAESKEEDSTWQRKILEYLAKRPGPVLKRSMNSHLNGGEEKSGGRYGTALRKLTVDGRVFVREHPKSHETVVTDDEKKFAELV